MVVPACITEHTRMEKTDFLWSMITGCCPRGAAGTFAVPD